MPWQLDWWDVSLELVEGERGLVLAYPTAIATVPRQAGKSVEQTAVVADRGRNWDEPQTTALIAQTGKDALEALRTKWWPRIEKAYGSAEDGGEVHFRKAHGSEALEWANGSRHVILPPKRDAGHGMTLDAVLIDEAWAYRSNVVEAAVVPAMLTRPAKQLRIDSTRGDETSTYLDGKIELGRESVDLGVTEGICYLEYSAPDDADGDDPATWWATHPALGFTLTESDMRMMRDSMASEPGEFDRAGLNRPRPRKVSTAIDTELWASRGDPQRITGLEAWAIFTGVNRSSCAIARAGYRADGRVQLLVMEHHAGVGWVPDKLAGVLPGGIHLGVDRLVDGAMVPELERSKVKVKLLGAGDAINAFAKLAEYLRDDKVRHARQSSLDEAVANATTRKVRNEEAVLFKRIGAVDISPLVASSYALWMLISDPQKPKVPIVG
jgi:hypothetical protein